MIIQSINQLKELASNNDNEPIDCHILLAGGLMRSSKSISYDKPTDTFYIFNLIDDSEQELTSEQLLDPSLTNIGEAITKKCLIFNN